MSTEKKEVVSWLTSVDASTGAYKRKQSQFQQIPAEIDIEKGRYHLYVSYACPWASRTLMARSLLGLKDVISVDVVDPFLGVDGWSFFQADAAPKYRPTIERNDHRDSVADRKFIKEVYLESDPDYASKGLPFTVPVLYDKKERKIVNNESSQIIRILNTQFKPFHRPGAPDLCPPELQQEIDRVNEFVYDHVNNGVYKCGFAKSQGAYLEAFEKLFEHLDQLERILSSRDVLVGNVFSEADIRLFTTLIRFDSVYAVHFKTNKRLIREYPALERHTRRIYNMEGVKETVRFDHITFH
jgi:putative glutathione S-transferase